MKKNTPVPIGEVEYLLPPKNGKTLGTRRFQILETGEIIDYCLFVGIGTWASTVLPLTINNEVIAINQFRYAKNRYLLELPSGCPDSKTETPEQVAARELLEETGYQATDIARLLPDSVWSDPASTVHGNMHLFLATNCTYIQAPRYDQLEFMETLIIPLGNWLQMIRDGSVRDQKSILATILAVFHPAVFHPFSR